MVEHLAFSSSLLLRECCERVREALGLPDFHFDSENETEWGLVEVDNIEYNVSRPFEEGTLYEWDETVPPGCNFGVSLIVYREHPRAGNHDWAIEALVKPFIERVAPVINVPIHHHRTWTPSKASP